MDMEQCILTVLRELAQDDFNTFKWFLKKPKQVNGLRGIPQSDLEYAVRTGTTDLIMQHYHGNETEVIVDVLKKIERHDLVERFMKGLSSKTSKHPSGSELQSLSTGATGTKGEEEFKNVLTSVYSTALSVALGAKAGPAGAKQGRRIGEAIGSRISNALVDVARVIDAKSDDDDDDDD